MKAFITIAAVAVLLVAAPGPCFALWGMATVNRERAKELGIEVRVAAAKPDQVRIEFEFKLEGELKKFDRVDLRLGDGDKPLVTATLKEDRSKEGRVVVSFTTDRTQLDKARLRVYVPGGLGGTIYEVRVKDFVEMK